MPEIAVAADRRLLPRLELGKFSLTAEMDEATAKARHLMTWADLNVAIDQQRVRVVVLSRRQGANFSWSLPSQRRLDPRDYRAFAERLLLRYHCTHANDFFLVFERADAKPKAFEIDPAAL